MKLIECPRDAMQGIDPFIPTDQKVRYLNQLLRVGFDTIDIGSFVSPKAVPQMRDTAEVLQQIDREGTSSELLTIVANTRGAQEACLHEEVAYLGFPFSISETFQQRNTNSSIEGSLGRVERIQELCRKHDKELVIYISMGFGNPYGDEWNTDIAIHWTRKLVEDIGVRTVSLADTIGVADPGAIEYLFSGLIPEFPDVEFGAHLHTRPDTWKEKVEAAWNSGCRRFDSTLKGFGGCPMAEDELIGNMATENLIAFLEEKNVDHGLDREALRKAMELVAVTFPA